MGRILKRIDYKTEFEHELNDYIKEQENRTEEQIKLDSEEIKSGFERFLKTIKYGENINPKKMKYKKGADAPFYFMYLFINSLA